MKQELFEHNSKEYTILIGQNKHDNLELVNSSSATDVWFHVEGIPSCHVILKTTEKMRDIPYCVIKRGAYLCKINSKAKTLRACNIAFTTINNVTNTNIIGQVQVSNCKIICI